MTSNPALFWGLIVSMWIGNLMLIILNLPLVGLWVKLLKVPYRVLYPAIILFCCIGVYSVNRSVFDLFLAAGFGLVGYLFRNLGCEPAPLMLGFVLGPMLEESFRRLPCAPVRDLRELVDDAHLRERGLLLDVEHPRLGPITVCRSSLRFEGYPQPDYRLSPAYGADTADVLREKLRLSEADLEALASEGALTWDPA